MRSYFVYIPASRSRVLYVGVTGNLLARVLQHKTGSVDGFTSRYRADRLVHFEETDYVHSALAREKHIKSWRRERKVALIERGNPTWDDLAADWYDRGALQKADSERSEESALSSFTPPETASPPPRPIRDRSPDVRTR